jgi:DNA modification methylase
MPAKETGLPAKNLMMMPARLALALQADGWWLRSDIIWAKPNPMPESCRDRPTSAHEHVFLLTKAARYFYDAEAVKEASITNDPRRPYGSEGAWELDGRPSEQRHGGKPRTAGNITHKYVTEYDGSDSEEHRTKAGLLKVADVPWSSRNLRNVWTIATEPFPGSHFATMPTELVSRCIRAGTSERGCCAQCGAPWVREISVEHHKTRPGADNDKRSRGQDNFSVANGGSGWRGSNWRREAETTGWAPGCACDAAVVPCTVLDPFAGAGTTLLVADRLQRDAIGIELSAPYAAMSETRLVDDAPLLAWGAAQLAEAAE